MSHRFFQTGIWAAGQTLQMDSEQSYHATRVLRLPEGSGLELFNGEGLIGKAILKSTDHRAALISVTEASTMPNPWLLTVAFSLGKPPATEFILKRVTELGVLRFQPLRSLHSHPGDFKIDRWEKILLEVCKQCQETHVPELAPLLPLETWLKQWGKPFLFCDEGERDATTSPITKTETAVVLGAEGGWDASEIATLRAHSGMSFGLGRNRLRAETAAFTAAILVKKSLGEIPSVVAKSL